MLIKERPDLIPERLLGSGEDNSGEIHDLTLLTGPGDRAACDAIVCRGHPPVKGAVASPGPRQPRAASVNAPLIADCMTGTATASSMGCEGFSASAVTT